jgi:serine/threonine-protein kinase HipA
MVAAESRVQLRVPYPVASSLRRQHHPEIVDALAQHGAFAKADAHALYRRVVFSVLISNVDDHLRNHGFLWVNKTGWSLSPAYDLNPVPTDLKARVLTTNINLDDATWRNTAKAAGARPAQINRMASAFEHDDLKRALAL